jgi:hypothetical protein
MEPSINARSLYAKTYAKHGKTIGQSKDAERKAYKAVEKKHGKDMLEKLKAFHEANRRGDDGEEDMYKKGGKISTAEQKNPKHKDCW